MKALPLRLFPWLAIIGILLAAALLLGSPSSSGAAEVVLVSNTGQSSYGGTPVGDNDYGQGFTTGGNTPGYVLTSIELLVHRAPANGTLTVSVRQASGQGPSDTVLYTLTNPSNLGTGLRTFTAPANAGLSANTTYFVLMTFAPGADPTQPQWGLTNRTNQDSASQAGWGIANGYRSRPSDSTGNWSNVNAAIIKIRVNGEVLAPAAPTNLTATAGHGQVTLSWTDPGDSSITKYQYNTDGGTTFTDVPGSDATTTSYTVTGLTGGTEYTFAVRAVNPTGPGEAATVTATPIPSPAAPTNLTATPRNGRVTLSWDDPGNDTITKYQYNTDGGTTFTDVPGSDATTTSYTVTGLTNGSEYTFAVRAVNPTGPGSAATVTATPGPPPAPVGLSAGPLSSAVRLTWDDPGISTITKYQYSTDGGETFTDIPSSGAETTTLLVIGLTNGTEYTFAVRAVNAAGPGLAATVTASPRPRPAAPAGLSATPDDGQVTLTWDDPGNSTITGYQYNTDGGETFTDIPGSDAGTTSYTVTGLTNGTEYTFSVRAVNPSGLGKAATVTATPVPRPAAPENLSATPGQGQVTLTWADPGNSTIAKYQYSTDGGETFTDIPSSGAATTSHTVTGLTGSTEYTFAVRAVNAAGPGLAATVTASPIPPPVAPEGLTATPGLGQVTLTWTDPGNSAITKYQLLRLSELKLALSDGAAGENFGYSVAIDGNTAVMGASGGGPGSAFVFIKNSSGVWTKKARLTAHDGEEDDRFGYSVAVEGDTVVVGAVGDDDGADQSGSAYVFVKPDTGWADSTETAKLTASDGEELDRFGFSTSVDGDTVLIGAPFDDDLGSTSGTAYVFVKPDTGWADGMETAKLNASNSSQGRKFAFSVAVDDDTILVGEDSGVIVAATGTAYVFSRPADGWASGTETAQLTASDGVFGDTFGRSVALDGDTAVVGADQDYDDGSGSAYVFSRPADGWADGTETAKLTPSDGASDDRFGVSVAVDRETVLVGSRNDDDHGDGSGSAYVFTKPATGWADAHETAKLTAFDGEAGDAFGFAVAVEGNDLLVGAYSSDGNASDSGSVYVKGFRDWTDIPSSGAETTSHTVTGLTGGTEYTFGVRASSHSGNGTAATVTAAPLWAAPANLVAAPDNQRVVLQWDTGNSGITNYLVRTEVTGGSGSTSDTLVSAGPGSKTTTDVTGLANGTGYTFTVMAAEVSGTGTVATGLASTVTETPAVHLPATPTGLTAAPGGSQVTLTWDDPGNITIRKYQYSTDGGTTFNHMNGSKSTTTSFTVTGLTNGTEYTLAIHASNRSGNGEAATVTATAGLPAPANLVDGEDNSRVVLQWDTGDPGITHYLISSEIIDGNANLTPPPDQLVPAGSGTRTTAEVTSLTNFTLYAFTVQAAAVSGGQTVVTGLGSTVNSTPRVNVPATPTNLTATPGDGQVAVTWDNPGNITIRKYQYSTDGGTTFNHMNGSDRNTTSFTFSNLTDGTEYELAIRASNRSGESEAAVVTAAAGFPAPANLVLGEDDGRIVLQWDTGDSGITHYLISSEIIDGSGNPPPDLLVPAETGAKTTVEFTGLVNYTVYGFTVQAAEVSGGQLEVTGLGSSVVATPQVAVPAPPTGLIATPGDGQVTVVWDNPGNITIRKYQNSTDGGANFNHINGSGRNTTSFTFTGLTNGDPYQFGIRASNLSGESAVTTVGVNQPPDTAGPRVSNLGKSDDGRTSSDFRNQAQAFTTGGNSQGYPLASIEVDLDSPPGNATLTAEIWDDDGSGNPGHRIFTLSNPANVATGIVRFTALADTRLDANTKYWVHLNYNGNTKPRWGKTYADGEDSGAYSGWSIANDRRSRTSSGDWQTSGSSLRVRINTWGLPASGPAPVYVSNLGKSDNGRTSSDFRNHAQAFTTGGNSLGYPVASIEVDLDSPPGNATLTVEIWDDDGSGNPGNRIFTLSNPANVATGIVRFTALADTRLDANTKYWVHLNYNGNTKPRWGKTYADGEDSGAYSGWSIANDRRSRTSSGDWQTSGSSLRVRINTSTSDGSVLASNLGKSDNGRTSSDFRNQAQAFTTGGNSQGYPLASIEVDLDSPPGNATLTAEIRGDDGSGNPGNPIFTLSNPENVATGIVRFTVPAGTRLDANTKYWVHLNYNGNTKPRWGKTYADGEDSGAYSGWSIANDRRSRTSSGDWRTSGSSLRIRIKTWPTDGSVLASNLGKANDGSTSSDFRNHAQAFTTGGNSQGYPLAAIEVVLHRLPGNATLTVEIWDDGGSGNPGNPIFALTSSSELKKGIVRFTAPADTRLDANTKYWVHLNYNGNTKPRWGKTYADGEDSGAYSGWSIANDRRSRTSSGDWQTSGSSLRVKIMTWPVYARN